jgi:hypothetical protein
MNMPMVSGNLLDVSMSYFMLGNPGFGMMRRRALNA